MKKNNLFQPMYPIFYFSIFNCLWCFFYHPTLFIQKVDSIDDLSPLLEETNNLFEEKGKYLTDDEKYEEKGKKLYHKCAKEIGLPIDQDLIVRGYKGTIPFSFRNILGARI